MSNVVNRTPSNNEISETLKTAVDKYISDNPEKYKLAQEYGEFLMSHPLANTDSFEVKLSDIAGDELLLEETLKKIKYYGFDEEDLSEYELNLLKTKYDIKEILKNN